MGLFFRKSESFGPFRLNFSKSGVGLSIGAKGARLSMGPNGTYINVGRNGIYYRKKLNKASAKRERKSTRQINSPEFYYENTDSFTDAIQVSTSSGNMSELGNAIIKDIKRATALIWIWWILLFMLYKINPGLILLFMLLLRLVFSRFFIASVNFDLDAEASLEWEKYSQIISMLKSSKKIWIVESEKHISNRKYNAGASRNISRGIARVKRIKPGHRTGFKVITDAPSVVVKKQQMFVTVSSE